MIDRNNIPPRLFLFAKYALIAILLSVSLCLVTYFVLVDYRALYHSDSTDTILWAEATYDALRPMNKDFYYACTLPFGAHLLMLPFIPFWGISFATHAAGMILFSALLMLSLYWCGKKMGLSPISSAFLVISMVSVLSSSRKLRDMFWGHSIYYSLGALFIIVGIGLVATLLHREEEIDREIEQRKLSRKSLRQLALIFFWFLLCCTNRLQAIVVFAVPLLFGLIGERLMDFSKPHLFRQPKAVWLAVGVGLLGGILGLLLGSVLSDGISADYFAGYSRFTDPKSWTNNFLGLPKHWLSLLGVSVNANLSIASPNGLQQMLRIAAAALLFFVPVILTFFYSKIDNRMIRIWVIVHWTITGFISFLYIFGRLSAVNWRLSPVAFSAATLTFLSVFWLWKKGPLRRLSVLAAALLLPFCVSAAANLVKAKPGDYKKNPHYRLAEYLEKRGLSYGYAPFWHASVITVLSDSKVKVRPIDIEQEVKPTYYQSNKRWYSAPPRVDEYFLLFDDKNYRKFEKLKQPIYKQSTEILDYKGYKIVVFDTNVVKP